MHDPLRPVFEREVPGITPGALTERIAAALAAAPSATPHRRAGNHFQIWIPDERRRLWSPWLHLDVNPSPDRQDACHLFGRFSPAPSLWSGVMLAHLALATLAVSGALFGLVQWSLQQHPWGLWLVPAAAAGVLGIWLSSRAGQSIAAEQMTELMAALTPALEDAGL